MEKSRSQTPHLIAANICCSWLGHAGVPTRRLRDEAFMANDVVVDFDWSRVDSRRIAGPAIDAVKEEWAKLTGIVGVPPIPFFDRTPTLPKRMSSGFDPLLSCARLNEYRYAPPLSDEVVEFYSSVIKSVTGSFYRRNLTRHSQAWRRMQAAGVILADIQAIAAIWATNFHHRYRREGEDDKTRRLFGHYCKQRCLQLVTSLDRKAPDIMFAADVFDLYEPSVEEDPTEDAVTAGLLRMAQALSKTELRAKISLVVKKNPELRPAAAQLMRTIAAHRVSAS